MGRVHSRADFGAAPLAARCTRDGKLRASSFTRIRDIFRCVVPRHSCRRLRVVPNLISLFISQYVLNDCSTCSLRARLRGRLIIETAFCVAGRAIGHERDQEGKYPLKGGSERGGEGHGVEPKGGIMESDQQQQFCLKWNSFGNNLATSFSNLFKSESLTDVTLFCEGKFLHTQATLYVFLCMCSRLVRHCKRIPSESEGRNQMR